MIEIHEHVNAGELFTFITRNAYQSNKDYSYIGHTIAVRDTLILAERVTCDLRMVTQASEPFIK